VGRRFLSVCAGVLALSWFGCRGANAIITQAPLDPYTAGLVAQAYDAAGEVDYYHFFYDEPSPLYTHCDANDLYDELDDAYHNALNRGDLAGAFRIKKALNKLGDELDYDDYLYDQYYWGHEDCGCLPWNDYFGPHSVFVEVQGGWSYHTTGVEEFSNRSTNGIFGGGIGLIIPTSGSGTNMWPGSYGFVKASIYGFSGSTPLFDTPGWSSQVNWLATGEFGLGGPISKRLGLDWNASIGGALASQSVKSPFGNDDDKLTTGYVTGAGLVYKVNPRLNATFDYKFVYLRDRSFSVFPGAEFDLHRSINIWTVGLRYTIGSTVH